MARQVVGMHFVCRGDANVTVNADGTFDTGFWKVARKHCDAVEYVALHESKQATSYRHGKVTSWHEVEYEGSPRVVFTMQPEGAARRWVGPGSGEKGYAWSD